MTLLSIIIPTRNRSDYLRDSVDVILRHTTDAEVIICDNSDQDILRDEFGAEIRTGRVKYSYTEEALSVVANFERAIDLSTGDYLMFIGDDDSIGPGLERVVSWAKSNSADAVISYCSSFIASYFWPGVRSKYFGDAYSGRLFVNAFDGRVRKIDPVFALRNVARRPGVGLGQLPRAYHGLVSRRLIDEIRAEHGHLFGGVSPDIYSATLIASKCRNAFIIDLPFIIPGASPPSTAGQGAKRSDRGELNATDHIGRFGANFKWDDRIPAFYAPHTVWAYSLVKALDRLPGLGIVPAYGRLYASCLLYYRRYREVFNCAKKLAADVGVIVVVGQILLGLIAELSIIGRRAAQFLMYPKAGGPARSLGPYQSISSAFDGLTEYAALSESPEDLRS